MMSLERILQALESEAECRLAEIEARRQAKIATLQAQTQAKITTLHEKHRLARQADGQSETVRILNQAKLKALQIELGAREALLASALERAACQLEERGQVAEARTDLLRQLIREALYHRAQQNPLQR
jgi:vacuolar-type H+-ATPase subunit E/Vma4